MCKDSHPRSYSFLGLQCIDALRSLAFDQKKVVPLGRRGLEGRGLEVVMGEVWWSSVPKMGDQELWQLQEWKRGLPSEPSQDPHVTGYSEGGREGGTEAS